MPYSQEDFAAAVLDYCDMHEAITEAAKDMKLLRQKKAQRGAEIMQYMEHHGIDAAELPNNDGCVRKYTSNRKVPVKKGEILQILSDAMGEDRAGEAMNKLEDDRPAVPVTSLKRQKAPPPKVEKKASKVQI